MSYIFFDESEEVTQEVWDKINTLTNKERFLASLPPPAGLPSWFYLRHIKKVRKPRARKPMTRRQRIKTRRRQRKKWSRIRPLAQKWRTELIEHHESTMHRPVQNRPR